MEVKASNWKVVDFTLKEGIFAKPKLGKHLYLIAVKT